MSIELDEDVLESIDSGNEEEKSRQIQLIFEGLDEEGISALLSEFCTNDRETFSGEFYVQSVFLNDSKSGEIEVWFTGSAHYGCIDADHGYEYTETAKFIINKNDLTIEFSTAPPDNLERPAPFDEF
ncbi:MAG: hypothetical protein V4726_15920 [Verrucomicrobiota bacterium]